MHGTPVTERWPASVKRRGAGKPAGRSGLEALTPSLEFVGAFLRRPASVGAVLPSSRFLARRVVACCELARAGLVAELGPGTGAFTGLILEHLGPETRFFALELDRQIAVRLRQRFPGVHVFNDSAENIQKYLRHFGQRTADCVVSGLPWANMPQGLQDRIMAAVFSAVREGGVFVTFAYLHARWTPSARRFRRRLEARFAEVKTTPVVWRNVPPAFVYACR